MPKGKWDTCLLAISKETGLEVNAEKTKYIVISHAQNARQYHNIKIGNKSFGCATVQIFRNNNNKSKLHSIKKLRAD